MKKKVQIHEFDPVIYPFRVWIIINKSPSSIPDQFNHYSGKPIEAICKSTEMLEAFVMPVARKENPKFGVIIFFSSKRIMTYEIVAHESSHAAKYLFEHIGADVKEHEPFEYVVGWIADCCSKIKIKNNKI